MSYAEEDTCAVTWYLRRMSYAEEDTCAVTWYLRRIRPHMAFMYPPLHVRSSGHMMRRIHVRSPGTCVASDLTWRLRLV